jgi:hypothetical protein
MSDELKERNILKLILIVRFACAILDVGHPTRHKDDLADRISKPQENAHLQVPREFFLGTISGMKETV